MTKKSIGMALMILLAQTSAWGTVTAMQLNKVPTSQKNPLLHDVNIFEVDDRVEVEQGVGSPYSPVGFLEIVLPREACGPLPEGQKCLDGGTAFLVSNRHILTNAHVAFRRDLRNLSRKQTSTFFLGWNGRHFSAKAKATPVAWGDYRPDRHLALEDWALLELDQPLGREYRWMTLDAMPLEDAIQPDFTVKNLGYPFDHLRDGKFRLMMDPECRIQFSASERVLWYTDCATRTGNSGGPIFYQEGQALYAVAITSASMGEDMVVLPRWQPLTTNIAVPIKDILPKIRSILQPHLRR